MALLVKAYLEKVPDHDVEIRRFHLQRETEGNFAFQGLSQSVANYFPALANQTFKICWKDDDGEAIIISSDEELADAIYSMSKEGMLRISVQPVDQAAECPADEAVEHPGVVCDECDCHIVGSRFNCCVCPNYDLCSSCERKGLHSQHRLFRIRTPLTTEENAEPWNRFRKWCQWMKSQHDSANKHQQTPNDQANGESKDKTTTEEEQKLIKDIEQGVKDLLNSLGIKYTLDVGSERCEGSSCASSGPQGRRCRQKCGRGSKCQGRGGRGMPWGPACGFPGMSIPPTGFPPAMWPPFCPPSFDEATSAENGATADDGNNDQWMADADRPVDPMREVILDTLEKLKTMGFTDDNGWLDTLVRTKNGDLNKVLDTLRSGETAATTSATTSA